VIGIALVLVQTLLVRPAAARLGEIGTVRMGLAANATGLLLLAADGGWATLVSALALLVVGQGLVTPTMSSVVAGGWPAEGEVRRSGCSSRRAASPGSWARRPPASCRRRLARVGSPRIDHLPWLPPGNMRSAALRSTRGSDA
jgi:hypothetical protein